MKHKRKLLILLSILVFVPFFYMANNYQNDSTSLVLQFELNADHNDVYQLFYKKKSSEDWSEERSYQKEYVNKHNWQSLKFTIPRDVDELRLDLGSKEANIKIKNVQLKGNSTVTVAQEDLLSHPNDIKQIRQINGILDLHTSDNDPHLTLENPTYITNALRGGGLAKGILSVIISVIMTLCLLFIINSLKDIYTYFRDLCSGRHLILNLAKNDFKTKYASSYLGIVWGFIQPLLTIATYWFVFQVGLRSGNVSEVPFILWFIVAIVPWFFFSEAYSSATNVYTEYSYLVKKVVFKIELLPMVKIVSAFFVHIFFIVFIFVIYVCYGHLPTIYNVQLIYYVFCSFALVFSLSLLSSAIVLFFKDLNQIIVIILQIGFWFTPIGWSYTMLPDFWKYIFKLNPMFYIVEGFRDTFINKIVFISHPYYTLYFWMFCLTVLSLGIKSLKKLKPHFADVI